MLQVCKPNAKSYHFFEGWGTVKLEADSNIP